MERQSDALSSWLQKRSKMRARRNSGLRRTRQHQDQEPPLAATHENALPIKRGPKANEEDEQIKSRLGLLKTNTTTTTTCYSCLKSTNEEKEEEEKQVDKTRRRIKVFDEGPDMNDIKEIYKNFSHDKENHRHKSSSLYNKGSINTNHTREAIDCCHKSKSSSLLPNYPIERDLLLSFEQESGEENKHSRQRVNNSSSSSIHEKDESNLSYYKKKKKKKRSEGNERNVDYLKNNTRFIHHLSTINIIKLFILVISCLLALTGNNYNSNNDNNFQGGVFAYQLTNNLIANNLPPKFITSGGSNSEIVVRVKEGSASIGKLIYTLKGEDPDEDPLTFGVLGSTASDLLRIENVPGNQANVYLRKELDRETTESHQVVITLTDGKLGRGNWITKSMLIIVEDVNDNYPVFGPHRTAISVREDVKVPIVIETIEASDQDEGRFGQVIYKLDESLDLQDSTATTTTTTTTGNKISTQPIGSIFSIDTIDGKGVISLISPLDYEQRALYQLRILATDRAIENERLTASTSILISVEDCEDQPPMFTFVPSITRIPENLPIGSPIVRLTAIDGDRGINNQIQYKLLTVNGQENGPERQLFALDPDSGQISVAHQLDRESSNLEHSTGGPFGSWLTTGGGNKYLGAGKDHQQQPGSYVLQIKAIEVNSNQPRDTNSVTTELTILLTDVNDETPTFNQATYFGEILENSAPESLVNFIGKSPVMSDKLITESPSMEQQQLLNHQAKVIDRDQGTNGTFTLHLEGEHSRLFEIWPHEATNEANFMIKLASQQAALLNELDFEKKKQFQFNIIAKEKYPNNGMMEHQQTLRSNSAQMIVFLKDSNDNYPQFEQELYKVEIPENAIKGMHVCQVRAHDIDSGFYGSEGIRYTEIRGEKGNKFKLDPLTGVITLKTNDHGFDRETVAQHYLIIEARDSNGLGNRNTTQLLIQLTDVNDQAPKFLLDQYEAFIYENELDFQSPLQVQAIDNDAQNSVNSKITYSIVGGDPQQNFTIDPLTGRIKVRSHNLIGPPGTGGAITTPHDMNGEFLYSPLDNDNNSPSNNSSIAAAASSSSSGGGLDFERIAQKRDDTRQFNLTIKASDSGIPEPLSDTTNVIILVYDKNDHAPIFTKPVYHKSIKEDAKEGSQVIQVLAQDGDHSPTNSKITYRISSGASDKFVIDSDSGLISVANGANLDIDRVVGGQKRTNYLLSIIAFDGSFGPNQKSSSALVNITIIDVNNKAPEFFSLGATRSLTSSFTSPQTTLAPTQQQQPQQQQQQQQFMVVHVNEDAPYGLIVTRVVANDLDSTADLRYSINYARSEARNEDMVLIDPILIKDLFSIEPIDGTIKVAKQLDRETFDQVKLRLQVEDIAAQTPDQIAHAYLLIKITDVNDNRPTFKKPLYKAVVNENSISGTYIITLTADDRDLNKTLKYSLDGTPEVMRLVRINSRSGEIVVNDKIDRELYNLLNVTVKAEDYGHPHSLIGTTQLLISVRDENDNNPAFLNQSQINHHHLLHHHHQQSRSNNQQQRSTIEDPKNHNMNNNTNDTTYRLRSLGASHRSFEISTLPTTAISPLAGINLPIDVDKLESILGDNNSNENLSTSSLINHLQLPLLSPGSTTKIREDAQIGHQFAYVKAEDVDVGNNGRVTYLLDTVSSGGKFRIERDTGILSVSGLLDRENVKQYSLIIEACDNYDLGYSTGESRRAFTQINIIITDINDNAPIISTNLQTTQSSSSASTVFNAAAEVMNAPSYDEVINSPGPYDMPLSDCLFISEFQPINEPILTVIATDADDPNTVNGQIDLTIVNNLPHNELFGLITIPSATSSTALEASTSTDQSALAVTTNGNIPTTTNDYLGFGSSDLTLSETSSAASVIAIDGSEEEAEQQDEAMKKVATRTQLKRPKRAVSSSSSVMEPDPLLANSVGNFYINRAPVGSTYTRARSIGSSQQQQSSARSALQPSIRLTAPPQATTTTDAPPGLIMPATMSTLGAHLSRRRQFNQSPSSALNVIGDGGEQQVHVIVTQSLKERVGNYSILVRATDRGQPALSSVKLINICVQDVNNHAPVFIRPPLNHTIRIHENATIGTLVTQVEATDSDYGLNGQLQYSIKQTTFQNNNNNLLDWQWFKIDRLTGIISTAKAFNRQVKKYYTLRVQAQDFGKPTSLSNDIDINIMIVNSGQYQPEFDVQTQNLQFTENVAPGVEWFALFPTTNLDDDPALINTGYSPLDDGNAARVSKIAGPSGDQQTSPSNTIIKNLQAATPCYFIVDSDDQDQIFHLDRYTHRLTNQKLIDRERKANYTLIVKATNSCSKPPSAPIYAAIQAQPTPTTTRQSSTVQNGSGGSSLSELADNNNGGVDYRSLSTTSELKSSSESSSINSNDDHINDKNIRKSRSIQNQIMSPLLKAAYNSQTNKTFLHQENNHQNQLMYRFNSASMEALLASDKSLLKVSIKIKDVNDNSPKFTQKIYTGGITTEADFGTVFMIVQAIDADSEANNQVVYSIVKPIKRNILTSSLNNNYSLSNNSRNKTTPQLTTSVRQKRATGQTSSTSLITTIRPQYGTELNGQSQPDESLTVTNNNININNSNDIPMNDDDDLFVINAQSGEISLNFDPQKHMKGYFEFEVMANDTDGFFDSAKVYIYLLRQDQRVKFVLRLTPQELRQRLNKFRSVFGNITGAIVNIDSYKYYENHDGTVDKKKTSLYLHFVNPDDNTIIDVDKVLTLIDNNIEYLDELYKEFHVLSSEAAHLPLSSSALIDSTNNDQVRTGLMGISFFLIIILVLVIALFLHQRNRYERQLKAATVSAFGSTPLHLSPDFQSQTNLPNTNLHSQDPNPIWINGYNDQDWLNGNNNNGNNNNSNDNNRITKSHHNHHHHSGGVGGGGGGNVNVGIEDGDYLSSENSDINSLNGINMANQLQHHSYNVATTATPRDSLNSSHGRVFGSAGSGSTSTTNDRQALCSSGGQQAGRQTPVKGQQQQQQQQQQQNGNNEIVGVLKNGKALDQTLLKKRITSANHQACNGGSDTTTSHSTFGAFKEVTIFTDHQDTKHQLAASNMINNNQRIFQSSNNNNNLVKTITNTDSSHQKTSQVNRIASQYNSKQQQQQTNGRLGNQQQQGVYLGQHQQQRIVVHSNGADVNQGIIKNHLVGQQQQANQQRQYQHSNVVSNMTKNSNKFAPFNNGAINGDQQKTTTTTTAANNITISTDNIDTNLNKLSILNLETTEL